MALCTKIITCCAILHNLAIQSGDYGDDLEDPPDNLLCHAPQIENSDPGSNEPGAAGGEKRRNEILAYFRRRRN